jgi:hypothetical protein
MTEDEADVIQTFEHWAYDCDGEGVAYFEQTLPGVDNLSAMEIAALSAFFLGRNMDDFARFLADHARNVWMAEAPSPQSPAGRPKALESWQRWKKEQTRPVSAGFSAERHAAVIRSLIDGQVQH